MSACQPERLSALLDGDLSPRAAARTQRHLAGCAACRGELQALEQLRASLRTLGEPGDGAGPGEDAWPQLVQRLATDRSPSPLSPSSMTATWLRQWRWVWPSAALGALAGVALWVGVRRQQNAGPSDDVIIAEAEHEFRAADVEYLRAIDKLRGVTTHARDGWPEARRREYDAAQTALDSATERCQQVARMRPADSEAEALLFAAYRRQIGFFEEQLWRSQ